MYIIIETMAGAEYAYILGDQITEKNTIFNTQQEAEEYAKENAHEPLIIEIK